MTTNPAFNDNSPPPADLEATPYRDLSTVITRDDQKHVPHMGGFTNIYTGLLKEGTNPPMKVAIKFLRVPSDLEEAPIETRQYLNREVWIWSNLNHPNVLKFLGLIRESKRAGLPGLISPYCRNGTIMEYLGRYPEKDRIFLIKGVARGLEYLHQNDVVHGNPRPSNTIIDDSGNPLICGFGQSVNLSYGGFITPRAVGAHRYQAPELLIAKTHSTKATDTYAFALTSFKIWSGEMPYPGLQDHIVIVRVITKEMRPELPIPPVHGEDVIWPVLQECWTTNADDRLTMREVVQKLKEY